MGFVGLVIFFAYRSIYSGEGETIDQQSRKKNWIGYSFYCRNCGYAWEMTIEEWKTVGQKEKENFTNFSPRLSASKGNLDESFGRIEWKPPNPSRDILIVIGFIGAGLITSLFVYGVLWAKTHPHNSYAIVVNGIAAIFALFVYTGLIVVFRPKANKIVLIILILVTLIGLVLTALTFLLK